MHNKSAAKNLLFLVIGFVLGTAVTLLVLQMQGGGNLLKGTLTLTPTLTTKTSTSTTTDPALSTAIQRLPSGVRVNSTTDDEPGLTSENP